MARQHHGRPMFSPGATYRPSGYNADHPTQRAGSAMTTPFVSATNYDVYTAQPPLPPPPPVLLPLPVNKSESMRSEPSSKRRRMDEGPSTLKFVSQNKWSFSASQPWVDAQKISSPRGKTQTNHTSLAHGLPNLHQLPTPQTPHFPPPVNSSPGITRPRSTDHVSLRPQPAHRYGEYHEPSTPFPGTHAVNLLNNSQSESATYISSSRHRLENSVSTAVTKKAQDDAEGVNLPAISSSSELKAGTTTSKAATKTKSSHQTLSLEKDADRIAALMAAKRAENEATSFRQLWLQRQREYQIEKDIKTSSSEYERCLQSASADELVSSTPLYSAVLSTTPQEREFDASSFAPSKKTTTVQEDSAIAFAAEWTSTSNVHDQYPASQATVSMPAHAGHYPYSLTPPLDGRFDGTRIRVFKPGTKRRRDGTNHVGQLLNPHSSSNKKPASDTNSSIKIDAYPGTHPDQRPPEQISASLAVDTPTVSRNRQQHGQNGFYPQKAMLYSSPSTPPISQENNHTQGKSMKASGGLAIGPNTNFYYTGTGSHYEFAKQFYNPES